MQLSTAHSRRTSGGALAMALPQREALHSTHHRRIDRFCRGHSNQFGSWVSGKLGIQLLWHDSVAIPELCQKFDVLCAVQRAPTLTFIA